MPLNLDDAVIVVSSAVNQKINSIHQLTINDVEDACDNRVDTRWDTNEHGQTRLYVVGRLASGKTVMVVLWPTEYPNQWNLATAFPVP